MSNENERVESVMRALIRAYQDQIRPSIRHNGIDERDLAFEADLLTPSEMESIIYGPRKRNAVLQLFREMEREGLISMNMGINGVYRILPTSEGEQFVAQLPQPWYRKMWNRLRNLE
jgi:hypothetical protein